MTVRAPERSGGRRVLQAVNSSRQGPRTLLARHAGDVVRVLGGTAGLSVTLLAIERDRLTLFERDLFRLVNDLPDWLSPALVVTMQAGNALAGPMLAMAALLLGRVGGLRRPRRAALDLAVAGLAAWFAAKLVKALVQRPRPAGLIEEVFRRGSVDGMGFVSGHTAVATALVTAAGPYLPRRWRRAAWALPWIVGVARVYEGAHLPLDIVGGVAVGWVVGAALHLVLGAPHRIPGLDEAGEVLRLAGWETTSVTRAPGEPRGSFPFVAEVAGGESVFVKLLDPEPRDRDWIFRAARFLAFRDVRDEAAIADASAQADREGAMTLLARSNGARVPGVRAIERRGEHVWIVEDNVQGRDLAHHRDEEVSDDLLRDVWSQVAILRKARLAHRDLVASNLVVDADGHVWLVDFAQAQSSARGHALANDVAELLVTTGLAVGALRAVSAAADVLGPAVVASSLSELQPLALTAENRGHLRDHRALLDKIRREVASVGGITLAPPEHPGEPGARRTLVASAVGLAAGVLLLALAGPSDVGGELSDASLRWLGLAALAAALGLVQHAVGVLAAVDHRLGLGRTVLMQLAASGAGPGAAKGATSKAVVAHLERTGVSADEGSRAVDRLRRAALVSWGLLLLVSFAGAWEEQSAVNLPAHGVELAVLAIGVSAALLLLARGQGDRAAGGDGLSEPLRTPSRAMLVASSLTGTAMGALCTVAAVAAFGAGPSVAAVAAAHLAVVAVASLFPVDGAPGLAEVALVALLSAIGVPFAAAVAAALVSRLLLFWGPVLVGRVLARPLRRRMAI